MPSLRHAGELTTRTAIESLDRQIPTSARIRTGPFTGPAQSHLPLSDPCTLCGTREDVPVDDDIV